MKLSLHKDLAPLRAAAIAAVDREAGIFRSQFITTSPGQEMTYLVKQREAEDFVSGAATEGALPHLVAEAAVNGITVFEQAVEFLTMGHTWAVISSHVEAARMRAKAAIAAAKSPAEIEDAMPDWSLIAQP